MDNTTEKLAMDQKSEEEAAEGTATTMEKTNINGVEDQSKTTEIHYSGWKAMPFIIGNETFEKLGAIGTLSNLLIYLTTVFNMKSITAATIINVFNGTTNLATLVGAFLCDTYFGRYKTLGFATSASFMGLLFIQLTSAFKNLHPPHCGDEGPCKGPTAGQFAFLLVGFGLLIIGAAGVRPCNLAFGADQFNPNTDSGKRGIRSFFNWYFFTYTFAQMVSLTLIVYVQSNVSWALGLGIPAILMLIAVALFFLGTKIYVKIPANGSPMTSIVQVIAASVKKRKLKLPKQPCLSLFDYVRPESTNAKLPCSGQFRFLDKAAILTPGDKLKPDGSAFDPWKLCGIQQVEEVKCVLRVIPIWTSGVIYFVAIVQQQTYVVFQALQSNRYLGNTNFRIPAASYIVIMMLTMTLFIPIYDRIIVPFLQRITGKEDGITILQRVGCGVFLAILTMLVSALVENNRRTIALTKPTLGIEPRRGGISAMSGLWLIPQLTLAGMAEVFAAVGMLEFYYKQFPENMRSIGGALFYCAMAISSYLSSFLISVVHQTTKGGGGSVDWLPEDLNHGRLDRFYYMIAGLEVVNFGYFLLCAKWYKYKGVSNKELEVDLVTKQTENKTNV